MDFSLSLANVNLVAVLLAALSGVVLSGLWYAKDTFGKGWLKAGLKQKPSGISNSQVFVRVLVLQLITALVLALTLSDVDGIVDGASTGAVFGLGFVATGLSTSYTFEKRKDNLLYIDAMFHVVNLVVQGVVIAALV